MGDKTPIDKKKEGSTARSSEVNFGDVRSFTYSVVWSLVALLAVSYIGSTVLTFVDPQTNLKELFPINLNDRPYKFPPNAPELYTMFDALSAKQGADMGADLMEYLYPMKHPAFPYYSWFLPLDPAPACRENVGYVLAKWYSMTCAGAFSMWRQFYVAITLVGRWMVSSNSRLADFFLFYIYPYMLYYLVMLPVVPVLGYALAIVSSVINNIPGGWALTFAPMMGFVAAIANLFTAGVFNIYSWAMSMMLGFGGFAMGFVNFGWWWMVGTALWLYTMALFFLSPLLIPGGFKKVAGHFKAHRISLLIITLIIVLKASATFLAPQVTVGILFGALYCLYKIILSQCETPAAS